MTLSYLIQDNHHTCVLTEKPLVGLHNDLAVLVELLLRFLGTLLEWGGAFVLSLVVAIFKKIWIVACLDLSETGSHFFFSSQMMSSRFAVMSIDAIYEILSNLVFLFSFLDKL